MCIYFSIKSGFTKETLHALFNDHLINLSLFSLGALGANANFSVKGRQLDGDILQISNILPSDKAVSALDSH